jgi:hypothetical protein
LAADVDVLQTLAARGSSGKRAGADLGSAGSSAVNWVQRRNGIARARSLRCLLRPECLESSISRSQAIRCPKAKKAVSTYVETAFGHTFLYPAPPLQHLTSQQRIIYEIASDEIFIHVICGHAQDLEELLNRRLLSV